MRLRIVLASHNAKKLSELQALFDGLRLDLVTQGSLGIPEPEEPHGTFLENALAKARHAALATGGPALADDSGLCVDVLGGAPGVISAHYGGEVAVSDGEDREARRRRQDAVNNARLLRELQHSDDRQACFVSTLVALRSAADPEPLVAVGRWEGEILRQPRGNAGFGYDPLMFIPAAGRTVAEMVVAEKNALSHRARSAALMRQLMSDAWRLGP